MGLKKFVSRLRKKVKKGVNSLNPFKMKMPDSAGSPMASALVKRMKKRQGGEGFINAQVEDYGK